MLDYRNYNDYELVSMAQEKNEEAINFLHDKYKPLIYKKSKNYFKYLRNKGIDLDDLIQECTIGFEESISSFNPNEEGIFYTFTNLCMDRQLMNIVTKMNREKHKLLNEAIPLETLQNNKDGSIDLIEFIEDNSNNPELDLFLIEDFKELCDKIISKLTYLEECVFKLKIQGFDYKEIAGILDKDKKSIDNAIQRMKIKIKDLLKEENIIN